MLLSSEPPVWGHQKGVFRFVPISPFSSDSFRFAFLVFWNTPICSDLFRIASISFDLFSEQIKPDQKTLLLPTPFAIPWYHHLPRQNKLKMFSGLSWERRSASPMSAHNEQCADDPNPRYPATAKKICLDHNIAWQSSCYYTMGKCKDDNQNKLGLSRNYRRTVGVR